MEERELNRKVNGLLFKNVIYGLFAIAFAFLIFIVTFAILRVSWYYAFIWNI